MIFDLHLTEGFRGVTVRPLTSKGFSFVFNEIETTIVGARNLYDEAIERDLHVSFETAATRDLITGGGRYKQALQDPHADPEAAV
jgi:hypothetical protein